MLCLRGRKRQRRGTQGRSGVQRRNAAALGLTVGDEAVQVLRDLLGNDLGPSLLVAIVREQRQEHALRDGRQRLQGHLAELAMRHLRRTGACDHSMRAARAAGRAIAPQLRHPPPC